jgi:CheY-like chemotaxis protein
MADDKKTNEGQKRTILVAMGDAYGRNYTSMLLQRFGYHVYMVSTAKEAAEFVSVALPSLVIAEAGLASPGGSDLLGTMKRNSGTEAVPAILLSSAIDPAAEKQYRAAGYADVLPMPVSAEALYRSVQKAIEPYPRQSIRVALYLKANLEGNPAGLAQYAVVLSENGMFVRTTATRPVGARLQVSLAIKDRTIQTEAAVLYSHGFGDYPFKELGMGMSFATIRPEDKALIRSFIGEEIEKGIGKK